MRPRQGARLSAGRRTRIRATRTYCSSAPRYLCVAVGKQGTSPVSKQNMLACVKSESFLSGGKKETTQPKEKGSQNENENENENQTLQGWSENWGWRDPNQDQRETTTIARGKHFKGVSVSMTVIPVDPGVGYLPNPRANPQKGAAKPSQVRNNYTTSPGIKLKIKRLKPNQSLNRRPHNTGSGSLSVLD